MTTNSGQWNIGSNQLSAIYSTSAKASLYDYMIASPATPYANDATLNDITGAELLEVIEKGIYKTLVARRDDAKTFWEEEDDDASYGEYKALKDVVELLDAFIKEAPNSLYSGLRHNADRYDRYGRRY